MSNEPELQFESIQNKSFHRDKSLQPLVQSVHSYNSYQGIRLNTSALLKNENQELESSYDHAANLYPEYVNKFVDGIINRYNQNYPKLSLNSEIKSFNHTIPAHLMVTLNTQQILIYFSNSADLYKYKLNKDFFERNYKSNEYQIAIINVENEVNSELAKLTKSQGRQVKNKRTKFHRSVEDARDWVQNLIKSKGSKLSIESSFSELKSVKRLHHLDQVFSRYLNILGLSNQNLIYLERSLEHSMQYDIIHSWSKLGFDISHLQYLTDNSAKSMDFELEVNYNANYKFENYMNDLLIFQKIQYPNKLFDNHKYKDTKSFIAFLESTILSDETFNKILEANKNRQNLNLESEKSEKSEKKHDKANDSKNEKSDKNSFFQNLSTNEYINLQSSIARDSLPSYSYLKFQSEFKNREDISAKIKELLIEHEAAKSKSFIGSNRQTKDDSNKAILNSPELDYLCEVRDFLQMDPAQGLRDRYVRNRTLVDPRLVEYDWQRQMQDQYAYDFMLDPLVSINYNKYTHNNAQFLSDLVERIYLLNIIVRNNTTLWKDYFLHLKQRNQTLQTTNSDQKNREKESFSYGLSDEVLYAALYIDADKMEQIQKAMWIKSSSLKSGFNVSPQLLDIISSLSTSKYSSLSSDSFSELQTNDLYFNRESKLEDETISKIVEVFMHQRLEGMKRDTVLANQQDKLFKTIQGLDRTTTPYNQHQQLELMYTKLQEENQEIQAEHESFAINPQNMLPYHLSNDYRKKKLFALYDDILKEFSESELVSLVEALCSPTRSDKSLLLVQPLVNSARISTELKNRLKESTNHLNIDGNKLWFDVDQYYLNRDIDQTENLQTSTLKDNDNNTRTRTMTRTMTRTTNIGNEQELELPNQQQKLGHNSFNAELQDILKGIKI